MGILLSLVVPACSRPDIPPVKRDCRTGLAGLLGPLGFVLEHSSSRSRHSCRDMALLWGRHAASVEQLSRTRQAHSKNYFYWKRFASTKE